MTDKLQILAIRSDYEMEKMQRERLPLMIPLNKSDCEEAERRAAAWMQRSVDAANGEHGGGTFTEDEVFTAMLYAMNHGMIEFAD